MKILKILSWAAITCVVIYVILINFSSTKDRFECEGALLKPGVTLPTTAYIELEKYRAWVSLWSDSNGNIHFEIPNELIVYYPRLSIVANQIQISSHTSLVGNLSTLSNALTLKTSAGLFEGTCKRISENH